MREMNPKFISKVFNGQSKETQSTYKFQIVHKTKPNLLFYSISPVDIQNRGSEIYLVLSYAIISVVCWHNNKVQLSKAILLHLK